MLRPIITPSQTAVMLADGSASKIGATIGTTTTAISIKSRKKPSRNITSMTTINCAQNPPGKPDRKCFTTSSPPNPRKAAVSIAAPSKIIKTRDVVFAVSDMTSRSVSSIVNARHPLHAIPAQRPKTANVTKNTPNQSEVSVTVLMLRLKLVLINQINKSEMMVRIDG